MSRIHRKANGITQTFLHREDDLTYISYNSRTLAVMHDGTYYAIMEVEWNDLVQGDYEPVATAASFTNGLLAAEQILLQ